MTYVFLYQVSIAPLLARVIETERTIRDRENQVPEKIQARRFTSKTVSVVVDEEDEYVMDEKSSD